MVKQCLGRAREIGRGVDVGYELSHFFGGGRGCRLGMVLKLVLLFFFHSFCYPCVDEVEKVCGVTYSKYHRAQYLS